MLVEAIANSIPGPPRISRILLVDDDDIDIRSIERHLHKSGLNAQIDVIQDPVEAHRQVQQTDYDCMLLDYRFPMGDAFELFGDLLSTSCSKRPSIVMLTGMGDERVAAESIQRGAQEYLSKSELGPSTLRRLVESACEKADMQRVLDQRNEQLVRMSLYDTLTGLPNRQLFFDRLGQAKREAERSGKTFAVLMMDLNLFKNINDSLGHDCGDETLRQVAKRLQAAVRDADTVARLGGDEFAALLSTSDSLEGAVVVAEKICASLSEHYLIDDNVVNIGVSVGVALYPQHADDTETLMRYADIAMYEAKSSHCGVFVYGNQGSESGYKAAMIAQGLRSALQEDQLYVLYQPQVRLADNKLVGAEALVRWRHPQLGLLPPDKFIPAAERSEIIEALTIHVLSLALKQTQCWRDQGFEMRISANLSARLLDRESLVSQIDSLLSSIDVPPSCLCLEVTETGIMQSPEIAERTLTALSGLGIKLSIDDFGTGYSSLKYLRNFPIDEIKIDRLFVSGVGTEQRDNLIVESILALGKAFNVGVVAEGIEDEATSQYLRSVGCEYGQGYHIAKPMNAIEFENWHWLRKDVDQLALPLQNFAIAS